MEDPEDVLRQSISGQRATGKRGSLTSGLIAAAALGVACSAFAVVGSQSPGDTGSNDGSEVRVVSGESSSATSNSGADGSAAQVSAAPASIICPATGRAPESRDVRVINNERSRPYLKLNGVEWDPKGVQIRAFVTSREYANALFNRPDGSPNLDLNNPERRKVEARTIWNSQDAYTSDELAVAGVAPTGSSSATFGADELRFQVSQWALNNPGFNKNYFSTLTKAVNDARCAGFVVILSMQAQDRSGPEKRTDIPSVETWNAWKPLIKLYGQDLGVMMEIYNEPGFPGSGDEKPTDAQWRRWAYAGHAEMGGEFADAEATVQVFTPETGSANGTRTVRLLGMLPMIERFRAGFTEGQTTYAAKNVLILDGLGIARTFENFESLGETNKFDLRAKEGGQFIYAVHPYLRNPPQGFTSAQLETKFGKEFGSFNNGHYVLSTEWSAQVSGNDDEGLGLGEPKDWSLAVAALNYLLKNKITMSAGAFDVPGVIRERIDSFAPTSYDNYCVNQTPRKGANAGYLIVNLFKRNYWHITNNPMSLNDGLSSSGTPKPC